MSKSSSQRAKRRQMLRDLRLECGECGSQIRPSKAESFGEVSIYMGRCSCGAVVQGAIGPYEVVSDFHAFMAGYAAAQGQEPPIASLRALPDGWHDGDLH